MTTSLYGDSLKKFAKEINSVLAKNKDGGDQHSQVQLLMSLEEKFRKDACKYLQSREIYRKFIVRVVSENKNILSAKPYFREKMGSFSKGISPAIKEVKLKELQSFHINFNLVKFIKDSWAGDFPEDLQKTYDELVDVRRKLIENNMPLVINRAKLFFRKTQESHLTLFDLIGIASMGLVSGVDKWVGQYSKVFNGVCIGRMVGNMIRNYSETMVHFFPSDAGILYRIRTIKSRQGIDDLTLLAEKVKESYQEDKKNGMKIPSQEITVDYISSLLNASAPFSADSTYSEDPPDDAPETMAWLDYNSLEASERLEEEMISNNAKMKLYEAVRKLEPLQMKVLVLKGVKI